MKPDNLVQFNGINNGTVIAGTLQHTGSEPMGDIARELCALIARSLKGMDMDAQIAARARIKAALEGEGLAATPPALGPSPGPAPKSGAHCRPYGH